MTKKFVSADLEGGPGASHENHKEPNKSKPHGESKQRTRSRETLSEPLRTRVEKGLLPGAEHEHDGREPKLDE